MTLAAPGPTLSSVTDHANALWKSCRASDNRTPCTTDFPDPAHALDTKPMAFVHPQWPASARSSAGYRSDLRAVLKGSDL